MPETFMSKTGNNIKVTNKIKLINYGKEETVLFGLRSYGLFSFMIYALNISEFIEM